MEVHRVDLGIGYTPAMWPKAYVEADLPFALASMVRRIDSLDDPGALLAWIYGRADAQPRFTLRPY